MAQFKNLLLYLTIAIFLVIRLAIAAAVGLAPDEAYYWYWSQHPDLSYFDHPPMVAYVMAVSTYLGGNNEFFVRLGGLVLSLGAMIIIFLTARKLFPKNCPPAAEILFLLNISLLFAAAGIIQTPDTPLMFFWSAALYAAAAIITGGNHRWWYLLGVFFGLGLLSKYTMILFSGCLVLFLLVSPAHRFWFARKEPYLALMLAFIVFSPVLIWNWRQDWISFGYQLTQGFSPQGINRLLKLLEFLGGQAAVFSPLLFAAFCWYSLRAIRSLRGDDFTPYLFLITFSWPVVLFFAASTLMGKIAEANWPGPAYIAGMILLWSCYHQYGQRTKRHRAYISAALGLALITSLLVQVHLLYPFLPIAPKIDPTHQFHGWAGLGKEIDRIIVADPHPEGHFLLADRGTTLAEALFYTPGNYIGFDPNIPGRYLFLPDKATLINKNAVILLHNSSEASLARFRGYFDELDKIGSYTPTFRGEKMEHLAVSLYQGRGYRGGGNQGLAK